MVCLKYDVCGYVRMLLNSSHYNDTYKKKVSDLFFNYLDEDNFNNVDMIKELISNFEDLAITYDGEAIADFTRFFQSKDIDKLGEIILSKREDNFDESSLISFVNNATNLDYAKFEEKALNTKDYRTLGAFGRRVKNSNVNLIGNKLMQLYNSGWLKNMPAQEKKYKGDILEELIHIKDARFDDFNMSFEQLESMAKLQGDTFRAGLIAELEGRKGVDSSNMVDFVLASDDENTISALGGLNGVDFKRVWDALDRIENDKKLGQLKRED